MKCLNCGKEFVPLSVNQMYCCTECGVEYRKTHSTKRLYPAMAFDCACCGRKVVTEEGYNDKRTRFCSHKCEKKYWKHQYLKENVSTHERTNFHSLEEYLSYERRTNEG